MTTQLGNTKLPVVGEDGLLPVFDLVAKKWKRVTPVDAREMIAVGTAALAEPDVEVETAAGRVKMNGDEARRAIDAGTAKLVVHVDKDGKVEGEQADDGHGGRPAPVPGLSVGGGTNTDEANEHANVLNKNKGKFGQGGEAEVDQAPAGQRQPQPSASTPAAAEAYDFSKHDRTELVEFAKKAGIDVDRQTPRAAIVRSLQDAKFNPRA